MGGKGFSSTQRRVLIQNHAPNSQGVCRVSSLVCASQIRTKGHLYDALSHLRLCFTPHSYLISYFRNGRNLFRCLLILYLDPSACKATISLCCERRLHSAGKRRRQDTVGNIILDTITESKQHFCESQRQNLSIESSWSKSKMALLFGKT